MKKILGSVWIKKFLIPIVIFLIFFTSYGPYAKKLPVSYWDEIVWIEHSYFFKFFIEGDFKNKTWQSRESFDQSKLMEYSYGAWLYPLYLKSKNNIKDYDYIHFLIEKGFYGIDEKYLKTYAEYKDKTGLIKFDHEESATKEEYLQKYGQESEKTLEVVYYARKLNILLLALATIAAYFLFLQYLPIFWSVLATGFYGFNQLIIETSLKAHAEALFLLTFNLTLLFMTLYFTKQRKNWILMLFSVAAGLCMATKLNGLMLVIIFIGINTVLFLVAKKKKIIHLIHGAVPLPIVFLIFVLLNPFTYENPIKNIKFMFDSRTEASVALAKFYTGDYLPDIKSRIVRLGENFYSEEKTMKYNSPAFLQQKPIANQNKIAGAFFVLGLIYSVRALAKKRTAMMVMLITAIGVIAAMSQYLILDWGRYYVQAVIFAVIIQTIGMFALAKLIYFSMPMATRHS